MSTSEGLGYSVRKIFLALFFLTAVEVAWGMFLRDPRWFLWSGLLICALIKGGLIFMYFMHMRFERVLIWSLILPTPLLVLVIFGYVTPDVSFNGNRDYANGIMLDQEGRMVHMQERIRDASLYATHPAGGHEAAPAGQGAEQGPGAEAPGH